MKKTNQTLSDADLLVALLKAFPEVVEFSAYSPDDELRFGNAISWIYSTLRLGMTRCLTEDCENAIIEKFEEKCRWIQSDDE